VVRGRGRGRESRTQCREDQWRQVVVSAGSEVVGEPQCAGPRVERECRVRRSRCVVVQKVWCEQSEVQ